jgi:NAD(P)-dependent dehydrogenase (short-subunit alcohol dehydrogenase family)
MSDSRNSMNGRVCLVTGATHGIGTVVVQALAERGATVVATGRNDVLGTEIVARVIDVTGNPNVHFLQADLARQSAVRALAAEFMDRWPQLHVLVNNAGTVAAVRRLTPDGVEQVFAVNHLAPFLLTHLLLPALRTGSPSRIITVSSYGHRRGRMTWDDLQGAQFYFSFRAYAQSKLANLLFTYELARRLEGTGISANAVNPGLVRTNIGMDSGRLISIAKRLIDRWRAISPEQGADTVVWLASSPDVEELTGQYFERRSAVRSSRASYDIASQQRLWRISERLTGLG